MSKTIRHIMTVLALFGLTYALAGDAAARKMVAGQQNCKMQENASINISSNNQKANPGKVQELIDQWIAEVEKMGKENGMEKVELQSMNYNIYANNNNYGCGATNVEDAGPYQYNANANFNVGPMDKAPAFMEMLIKEGYVVNLNVNAYKQCQ